MRLRQLRRPNYNAGGGICGRWPEPQATGFAPSVPYPGRGGGGWRAPCPSFHRLRCRPAVTGRQRQWDVHGSGLERASGAAPEGDLIAEKDSGTLPAALTRWPGAADRAAGHHDRERDAGGDPAAGGVAGRVCDRRGRPGRQPAWRSTGCRMRREQSSRSMWRWRSRAT